MEYMFGVCPETYRISDSRGMDDDVAEELVDLVMQQWSNLEVAGSHKEVFGLKRSLYTYRLISTQL